MLQDPNNPWVATAAVDSKSIGIVQVRMLAHLLLGNKVPITYSLKPVLITKSMLLKDSIITMDSLYRYVSGWGEIKAFQLNQEDINKIKSFKQNNQR